MLCFIGVQLDLFSPQRTPRAAEPLTIAVGAARVPIVFVRNPRARRYILRLTRAGVIRVTIPRAGSVRSGVEFVHRNSAWLARQWQRRTEELARQQQRWSDGATVLVRGEPMTLRVHQDGERSLVSFGQHRVELPSGITNVRQAVERYLRQLAHLELPPRTLEIAREHALCVQRVTVRDQRSRWGSCSPRGTISLNWHLIQTPPVVRDYLIIHELMHLREMNHSPRFWRWVELACPDYMASETWLNSHGYLLQR